MQLIEYSTMEINEELILKLEKLSRLDLEPEDRKIIKDDLRSILNMIDKLQEVDTDGEEPLIYMNQEEYTWRVDKVNNELNRKDALKNAPNANEEYFTVPKVLNV